MPKTRDHKRMLIFIYEYGPICVHIPHSITCEGPTICYRPPGWSAILTSQAIECNSLHLNNFDGDSITYANMLTVHIHGFEIFIYYFHEMRLTLANK